MSEINFCPQCGQSLTPQVAFCPHCGMNLRRDETATSTSKQTNTPPRNNPSPSMSSAPKPSPQPQGFRPPHQWMEMNEAPQPVVPLAPTPPPHAPAPEAYRPPVAPSNTFFCPDCGGMVSRSAMACPRCGRRFAPGSMATSAAPVAQATQTSQPPLPQWAIILLIAIAVGVVVMYFC